MGGRDHPPLNERRGATWRGRVRAYNVAVKRLAIGTLWFFLLAVVACEDSGAGGPGSDAGAQDMGAIADTAGSDVAAGDAAAGSACDEAHAKLAGSYTCQITVATRAATNWVTVGSSYEVNYTAAGVVRLRSTSIGDVVWNPATYDGTNRMLHCQKSSLGYNVLHTGAPSLDISVRSEAIHLSSEVLDGNTTGLFTCKLTKR